MNKTGLIAAAAAKAGVSKAQAEKVVRALFDEDGVIAKTLMTRNGEVALQGFGTFCTKKRKARTARNPQTNETVQVPARHVVAFRVGSALKKAVS
jgi:DNA-binding protein HU-beta